MQFMPYEITRIDETSEKIEMYDIQVPEYNNFILEDGIVTHNCGFKGFKEVSRESKDQQKVVIEEDINIIDPTQKPRRIVVLLEENLCHSEIDKEIQPGRKVMVSGIIKEKSQKDKSLIQIKYVLANNIEVIDDTIKNITISKEEEREILTLSKKSNLVETFKDKIFGTIYGHDEIKEALILHLVGGDHLYIDGKLEERGPIHILLVGSPGGAKTKFLKSTMKFMPNSRFTSATGSSGVGLVATVVKDEEMGGWVLESGVIPMSNNSSVFIDELDKMSTDDMGKLNNVLVDMEVHINKASIHSVVQTDVGIVATANPKNRVFDSYDKIWKQIKFPKDFLDRFDLVIPMETIKTEEHQRKIVNVIFDKYKKQTVLKENIDNSLIVKYISYARNRIKPEITIEAQKEIEDLFIKLIKPSSADEQAYMSTRLLTNIIRLATASAKLRLSKTIDKGDALIAINLIIFSLKKQEIIVDEGSGLKVDINSIVPKRNRDIMNIVMNVIKEIRDEKGLATYEKILSGFKIMTGMDESVLIEAMDKLSKNGDIIQPRIGTYKILE